MLFFGMVGNKSEIEKFMCQKIDHAYTSRNDVLMIPTLEGYMSAYKGDLIIKGVKGEFYPCKPDIFNLTYEKVIEEKYLPSEGDFINQMDNCYGKDKKGDWK